MNNFEIFFRITYELRYRKAHVNHQTRLQTNRWKQIQTWIIIKKNIYLCYYNTINIISKKSLEQYDQRNKKNEIKTFHHNHFRRHYRNMRRISVFFYTLYLRWYSVAIIIDQSHTKIIFWLPFIYWIYFVMSIYPYNIMDITVFDWVYMPTFIMGS